MNGKINPVTLHFEYRSDFNSDYKKYKYIGKEIVEGKEYIEVELIDNNNISKECYYIDVINKVVAKKEYYSNYGDGFELDTIFNYTYLYNTVTDEDVLEFDINNYPEYLYEENSN